MIESLARIGLAGIGIVVALVAGLLGLGLLVWLGGSIHNWFCVAKWELENGKKYTGNSRLDFPEQYSKYSKEEG